MRGRSLPGDRAGAERGARILRERKLLYLYTVIEISPALFRFYIRVRIVGPARCSFPGSNQCATQLTDGEDSRPQPRSFVIRRLSCRSFASEQRVERILLRPAASVARAPSELYVVSLTFGLSARAVENCALHCLRLSGRAVGSVIGVIWAIVCTVCLFFG